MVVNKDASRRSDSGDEAGVHVEERKVKIIEALRRQAMGESEGVGKSSSMGARASIQVP
jgi:hypothetical protein